VAWWLTFSSLFAQFTVSGARFADLRDNMDEDGTLFISGGKTRRVDGTVGRSTQLPSVLLKRLKAVAARWIGAIVHIVG